MQAFLSFRPTRPGSSRDAYALTQRHVERPCRLAVAVAYQRGAEDSFAIVSGGSGRIPQQFHLGTRIAAEQTALLGHDGSDSNGTFHGSGRTIGAGGFTHP